jgi:hypothetical protein
VVEQMITFDTVRPEFVAYCNCQEGLDVAAWRKLDGGGKVETFRRYRRANVSNPPKQPPVAVAAVEAAAAAAASDEVKDENPPVSVSVPEAVEPATEEKAEEVPEEPAPAPPPWGFDSTRSTRWSGQVLLPATLTTALEEMAIECSGAICLAPGLDTLIEWPNKLVAGEKKPCSELGELDLARTAMAVWELKGKSPQDKKQIKSRNALAEEMLECDLGQGGYRLLLVGAEAAKQHCATLVGGLEPSNRMLVALVVAAAQ